MTVSAEVIVPKRKRKKGLPKNSGEWQALSDQEVMEKVFGKRGQQTLKTEAEKPSRKPQKDYRTP